MKESLKLKCWAATCNHCGTWFRVRRSGLFDLWGGLAGWGGGNECSSNNWIKASPFLWLGVLSLNLSQRRDQACPALWLQGFGQLLKSWVLASCRRPELKECLLISAAAQTKPFLRASHICRKTTLKGYFAQPQHLKGFHTYPSLQFTLYSRNIGN